ncbi:MAG: lipoprotein insertase outer membrane protein LolB [Spongiibacteraceae bacterium]|jgi:outer membrane lipoprotein LolB|nr:lipoprotein insertase outer membrane protein LolB [Spongiibacteraceae bacterium]
MTLALASLILAGCAAPALRGPVPTERWELAGKLGLRNARQAESAWLNWRQCNQHYLLRLSGPLGQGLGWLEGNAHIARLHRDNSEAPQITHDPESSLEELLGTPVPVGALRYWARGEPAPRGEHRAQRDAEGRLTHLEQYAWSISYPSWHAEGLPARLVLTRADLRLTLLIKSWSALPAEQCPTWPS